MPSETVRLRAALHAATVTKHVESVRGGALTEEDIASAFVVGYEAGREDQRRVIGGRRSK